MDGHFEEEFPPPPNPGQPGDTNNILIQRMASRYIPLLFNMGISPPAPPQSTWDNPIPLVNLDTPIPRLCQPGNPTPTVSLNHYSFLRL